MTKTELKNTINELYSSADPLCIKAAIALEASIKKKPSLELLMKNHEILINAVDEMGKLSFERDNPNQKTNNSELELRLNEITVVALDTLEIISENTKLYGKKLRK
jgi:hypothetical protein